MDENLKKVIEFTDEELTAQEDPFEYAFNHQKGKLLDALEAIDKHVTDEMMNAGMDLRITIEVVPR